MPKNPKTHSVQGLPLVAIELGSHSVRAMLAERLDVDLLHVLAYEESDKFACVDRGIVSNANNASFLINELLHLLSNRLNIETIPSAFTLIGGRDMQIVDVRAKRDLIHPRLITEELKEELRQECINKIEKHNEGVGVFDAIPSYFILDGKEQDEELLPTQKAAVIEGHYTAFVGHKEAIGKLNESFNNAKVTVERTFVRPDAILSAISAEDSDILKEGCALIDFGAQTTTVSVYKGNEYLFNKVIPLGGWHISRFIEQQGVPFHYAERIKCMYGNASARFVEKDQVMTMPSNTSAEQEIRVTFKELAQVIEMKLSEMVQPALTALQPFMSRISRIYITGGGSMLQGLIPYIQERTQVSVMYGSHAYLLDRKTDDEYCKPKYTSLVGALILAGDWRAKHQDQVVPDKKSFSSRLKNAIQQTSLNLFTDNTY